MDANKTREPIPEEFESIEAAAEFWDTHSLADYWDETSEAEITVRARRRQRVSIAPELWARLQIQARKDGVSPETLVNLWLAEWLAA